jgi:hypothetical protein
MIPTTVERVPRHSPPEANRQIQEQTEANVACYGSNGPAAIDQRLRQLDHEWDIERTLEANAATIVLIGVGLSALVDRRFLVLPAMVAGFLLQHAVQGWCPPVPLFRRLGIRTQPEIEQERYALKALRGDFRDVTADGQNSLSQTHIALDAARR